MTAGAVPAGAGLDGGDGRPTLVLSPNARMTVCALSKGCPSVFRGDMPCQLPPGHLLGDLPHRHECVHIPGCTDWVEWDSGEHIVATSRDRVTERTQ